MLAAAPVAAQEEGDISRGTDLLSEGARLLLRGLLDEVEPAMRDMVDALEDWNIEGLSIDDLSNYHAPEVLPNGDILIRRKEPLEAPAPPLRGEGPEIDL
jgi:hypothetical protein